jgi:hypothetical protein
MLVRAGDLSIEIAANYAGANAARGLLGQEWDEVPKGVYHAVKRRFGDPWVRWRYEGVEHQSSDQELSLADQSRM